MFHLNLIKEVVLLDELGYQAELVQQHFNNAIRGDFGIITRRLSKPSFFCSILLVKCNCPVRRRVYGTQQSGWPHPAGDAPF